jgi:small redox-active disulfide protein 2
MKIQVAGPGCLKCQETEKNVREACSQLKLDADIQHVHDIKEIVKLGVLFTPAVIIDGKIVLSGKSSSVQELKKIICKIKEG